MTDSHLSAIPLFLRYWLRASSIPDEDDIREIINASLQKHLAALEDRLLLRLAKMMGDDDLISIGRASSLLGVDRKTFRKIADCEGFQVYYPTPGGEKRYNRGEILEYREKTKK